MIKNPFENVSGDRNVINADPTTTTSIQQAYSRPLHCDDYSPHYCTTYGLY